MVTTIHPGVYDITTLRDEHGQRYRTFLFDDDVSVLVDTCHAESVETLSGELDSLGIRPDRLLITHGHGDHTGGIDGLVDRYDIDLIAPEGMDLGTEVSPDRRVSDGDRIGSFTAVHVPGHTPHHFAYVHTDRSLAVLGDAVFGSDYRGLPAGYFVLPPGLYSEDLDRADAALERLLEYEFETALLYHGSSVRSRAADKLARFVNFPGR